MLPFYDSHSIREFDFALPFCSNKRFCIFVSAIEDWFLKSLEIPVWPYAANFNFTLFFWQFHALLTDHSVRAISFYRENSMDSRSLRRQRPVGRVCWILLPQRGDTWVLFALALRILRSRCFYFRASCDSVRPFSTSRTRTLWLHFQPWKNRLLFCETGF